MKQLTLLNLLLALTCLPARAATSVSGGIFAATDTTATNARPSLVTITPITGAGTNVHAGAFTATNDVTIQSITASRALVSGSDKSVTNSVTTATELGYSSGVTSGIQGQLDSKATPANILGAIFNTGTPTSTALPAYSNTSGTNVVPSNLTVSGGTNLQVGALTATNNITVGEAGSQGSITLGDADGSNSATITPSAITTTDVNLILPAAPFTGLLQGTVSSGTNMALSLATSFTGSILEKGPIYDITAYGANGSGTTTTVSSWSDSTHVTVADASSFVVGENIGIDRAGGVETTGNTSASSTTISSVASTNGFTIGDYIRVIGGRAAQAQVRTYTIKVSGNDGDIFTVNLNGTNYSYTVSGSPSTAIVATNLAAAITGDAGISATVAGSVVSVTAAVAGTPFTYANVRPTGRAKITYATTAASIPLTDVVVLITGVTATTFTTALSIPSSVTGARIEKYDNRLLTTISAINSNTLTLAGAATTNVTGVTVYHNSEPAFVLAVAAATANGTGTVYVPDGTFYLSKLSAGITMGNASVIGNGNGRSILKAPKFETTTKFKYQTTSNGASNIVLRDFTLDLQSNPYTKGNGYGITIGNYTTNGYNTDIRMDGIEVGNCNGQNVIVVNPRRLTIQNCYLHDSGGNTLGLLLWDNLIGHTTTTAYDIWITDNLFVNSGHIACNIYAVDFATSAAYTTGTYSNVHADRNTFRNCALLGLEYYVSSYDSTASGNLFSYCGGVQSSYVSEGNHGAMAVKFSSDVVVEGNEIADSANGIEVFGVPDNATAGFKVSSRVSIRGNSIRDGVRGIVPAQNTDLCEITDNIIDGMDNNGIQVGGLDSDVAGTVALNTRVLNNVVRGALAGIVVNPAVNGIEIRGNTLDSNNTFEENNAKRSAIALNASGDGTFQCTNIVITGNRMLEQRVTPTKGQMNPVYGDFSGAITLNGNTSISNVVNTYTFTTNVTLTLSTLNSWDASQTWAVVSALTPPAGTTYFVSDIGVGTYMSYVGSRWKPFNGRVVLKTLGVAVSGITNTGGTLLLQTLIPAGAWKTNDLIRITTEQTKSGATDTGVVYVTVGTGGTISDTKIINAANFMAAANLTYAGFTDLKLTSDTAVQKVGGSASFSTGAGALSVAALAPVTISSASGNALYVSVFVSSSGASNTVGADYASIELITP